MYRLKIDISIIVLTDNQKIKLKGKEKMEKKNAKKSGKAEKAENKSFSYLSLREATNNFTYMMNLARKENFSPKECYLVPRSDHYGPIKDVWNKEVICSYDLSFEPIKDGIKCIAFDVTGQDRPRRVYDPHFDNISHIKICELSKDKSKTKYLILKPLQEKYLEMKTRTQERFKSLYEKKYGINVPTK